MVATGRPAQRQHTAAERHQQQARRGGPAADPVAGMIESLATSSSAQVASVTRGTIGSQLDATVGDFCRKAIAGRYPFNRGSPKDVHPDDFGRMFAAGGLMDDFFQKNLASLVDISTRPWSFKKGSDGTAVGTSAALVAFERAAVIRDALFRAGGARSCRSDRRWKWTRRSPRWRSTSTARCPLHPRAAGVDDVVWPGPRGNNLVSLQLTRSSRAVRTVRGALGAAPLLRPHADDTERGTGTFNAEINVDGRRVTLEINASSVLQSVAANSSPQLSARL
jgi:type VI secretion system protein ImpL